MIRISFVVGMLVLGFIYGGWWGVWSALILTAIVLRIVLGPYEPQQEKQNRIPQSDDWDATEVISGGIKGHRDPTRPIEDDYAAMITDNYGKRRA